ncbi:MAG: MoaD/ThiS family protein [Deltaproteobacteria bacterium]|nr:MoaD/ThiS family protein [Deltaproteobacteria bacterium]
MIFPEALSGGMMRISVKLFATLGRHVSGAGAGIPLETEVPDGATVADLVNQLKLPGEEVKVAFVNGRTRPLDWLLHPEDEVGIFPPIGGG